MADSTEKKEVSDPSVNVIALIESVVKHLEFMLTAIEKRMDAESARINELRAVDIAAVATANERAVKQAEVLATSVATNAETLRASVAKTADTIAVQLQQITDRQNEKIAAIEKIQNENVGKSGGSLMTSAQFRNGIITIGAILSILGLILTYFYKG